MRVAMATPETRRPDNPGAAMEKAMDDQPKNMKAVFTMVERTQAGSGTTKSYWTKVGVGFVNRDGSITLRLDALPINGTLQVREWEPYDRRQDGNDPPPRPRSRAQQPPADDSLL